MKKQFFLIYFIFCVVGFLTGCGTNNTITGQAEGIIEETTNTEEMTVEEEPVAEGYETLGGMWKVGGIYFRRGGVYHRDKLIDIHDDIALEDLYDSVFLTFRRDGSFMYADGWIYEGDYVKGTIGEDAYILTSNSKLVFKDKELVAEEYKGTTKHLITMLDENTFEFTKYDPITGKAKADDYPVVFIRNRTASSFIDTNKIAIERKDNNSAESNGVYNSDVPIESSPSYEKILNSYTKKMKEAVPELLSEYRSATSGISDIEHLASICNEKIGELAEICNEGIVEMADLMYSKGDSYTTYEKWASKLMENYTNIAMEISEAYIESVLY